MLKTSAAGRHRGDHTTCSGQSLERPAPWRATGGSRSGVGSTRPAHDRPGGVSAQHVLGAALGQVRDGSARCRHGCALQGRCCAGRLRWGRGAPRAHLVTDDEVFGVGERRQHARDGREVVRVDDALLGAHELGQARLRRARALKTLPNPQPSQTSQMDAPCMLSRLHILQQETRYAHAYTQHGKSTQWPCVQEHVRLRTCGIGLRRRATCVG